MTDLRGLALDELEHLLTSLGEPRYRAAQVAEWIFKHAVADFDAMTNLPKALRRRLATEYGLSSARPVGHLRSSIDGTEKLLLEFADGTQIEAVVLRDDGRATGCVSTQVGCRFGCTFCATGAMGFVRDLTAGEIVEEILALRRHLAPERLDNLVFMGMGEPFDNYDATLAAVKIANAPWGLGIGARRMTISTAGHVPGIRRLAGEGMQVNLAVSLNAPDQDSRARIMPIAKIYPLPLLLEAVREFTRATGRMVTFEYVLLEGVNDSPEAADRLGDLTQEVPCKVNLICYNSIEDAIYSAPPDDVVRRFLSRLRRCCPTVVRRMSRGSDIAAGCGQLCVRRDRT